MDLLVAVRQLYSAMERFDAAAAARLGVDRTGLRAINAMERGAVSPGQLARELGLTSGSVTALLDRLERAGHIERALSLKDGRRRDAHLGTATRQQAEAVYGRLGAAIEEAFSADDPQALAKLGSGVVRLAEAFNAAYQPQTTSAAPT
jgi:DNA-binding MarR family transcriptional regulator